MFKANLKEAFEQGLLISAKWSVVLLVAYLALTMFTNVINGSNNGTQSALYINQLIEKGYLPKAVNGQVPPKVENETSNK